MLELCNAAWGISKMSLPVEKIDKGMQAKSPEGNICLRHDGPRRVLFFCEFFLPAICDLAQLRILHAKEKPGAAALLEQQPSHS